MNEEKLSIILDACSNYLVNAQGARGHGFESHSSRHNRKIAQWQSTYITKTHLVKYRGLEKSVSRRSHYPKNSGAEPLPATIQQSGQVSLSRLAHYQKNVGAQPTSAPKGCSRPQNTRTALTRICKLNYHFPPEELSLVTSRCMWLSGKRDIRKRSKLTNRICCPMTYKQQLADQTNKLRPI